MTRCLSTSASLARCRSAVFGILLCGMASGPILAEPIVSQAPHVRTEYAQVLKVEPIYQTLRAYTSEERCEPPPRTSAEASKPPKCRMVRIPREFRRVIAYDVDYIHRGAKYRSRLPYDPGKRLQVKMSIVPLMEPESSR